MHVAVDGEQTFSKQRCTPVAKGSFTTPVTCKGQNHQNVYQFQSKKNNALHIVPSSGMHIASSITCVIWKAICAGVSFRSGAETMLWTERSCTLSHANTVTSCSGLSVAAPSHMPTQSHQMQSLSKSVPSVSNK